MAKAEWCCSSPTFGPKNINPIIGFDRAEGLVHWRCIMLDASVLKIEIAALENLINLKKVSIETEQAALAELLQRLEFKKALLKKTENNRDLSAIQLKNNPDSISSLSE